MVCLYREIRCVFAIYTSIDTSSNVCLGKPCLLKVLCTESACMVYCRGASGYASHKFIYSIGLISGHFFFLVCLLIWKNNIIHGGNSGHNFYMGMQNRPKLEFWWQGLLIHASECKLWHSKVFPYVCNVAAHVPHERACSRAHMHITTFAQYSNVGSLLQDGKDHERVQIPGGKCSYCSRVTA